MKHNEKTKNKKHVFQQKKTNKQKQKILATGYHTGFIYNGWCPIYNGCDARSIGRHGRVQHVCMYVIRYARTSCWALTLLVRVHSSKQQ